MQVIVPILMAFCAVIATSLNSIVLYVFAKIGSKNVTFNDVFMISLAVGDLVQSLLGYSLEIYSMGERQGGKNTSEIGMNSCKAAGFIVTFFALSHIAHLTVIAFDQYLTVCKPFKANRLRRSFSLCFLLVSSCWLYSLAWASFPLMGWSGYTLEGDKLRCSIDWPSRELKDQIYIVLLFASCFLIPVAVMTFSLVNVKRELHKMENRVSNLFEEQSKVSKDKIQAEKTNRKLALVMCVVFIIAWMPYSLLSFWASFFNHIAQIPASLGTACAIIAKSSTIFNPVIYTIMHRRFRHSLIYTPFRCLLCCPANTHPSENSIQDSQKKT